MSFYLLIDRYTAWRQTLVSAKKSNSVSKTNEWIGVLDDFPFSFKDFQHRCMNKSMLHSTSFPISQMN